MQDQTNSSVNESEGTRIEIDSLGEIEVAVSALYGAQTQRAIDNFPISGQPMPQAFIKALLQVKKAAAKANVELELLDKNKGEAIIFAVQKLLDDKKLMSHFPVDVFQTGSGTSSNMNANEVIATIASIYMSDKVHPNDDVNFGQSSNDVIPTTIHVAAAMLIEQQLLPAFNVLITALEEKALQVGDVTKSGRTHLMDAMPVTFRQVLETWATQIQQNIQGFTQLMPQLLQLAQGGTAVGTGINTHPEFAQKFCQHLTKATDIPFAPTDNFFSRISSQDTALNISGQLKTSATSLLKIANDLRWMNSGPLAGLAEIELVALQPGSSIMPGKVNPVIPEAVAMAAAQVTGNDTTITVAAQSSNFELNVMLPVIARNLIESIQLLANSAKVLAEKAISQFKVNQDNINKSLARNPILVTALNPVIGYQKAAAIAKKAYLQGRPILDVAVEETDIPYDKLQNLLNPKKLTQGGL